MQFEETAIPAVKIVTPKKHTAFAENASRIRKNLDIFARRHRHRHPFLSKPLDSTRTEHTAQHRPADHQC
ncbi:MAG: hypothetical protein ACR652_10550 [Methylocystis sp.]|uniref:hypothetical protein n=1 Tax=Methylocystis sp. TaxID=1911079 RepID=UPI003DA4F806